jgi:hypothetical protein
MTMTMHGVRVYRKGWRWEARIVIGGRGEWIVRRWTRARAMAAAKAIVQREIVARYAEDNAEHFS